MTDVAQLGIFIRDVDASLTVTDEFVEMVPMTNTTTANDTFPSLVESGELREKVQRESRAGILEFSLHYTSRGVM